MFRFIPMSIPEVVAVETERFSDDRGYLYEHFKESSFKGSGLPFRFEQDLFSKSKKGIIRGLHYQTEPKGQGKLVSVVTGRIFDVAVDIRRNSPSFGKWVSLELSEDNNKSVWIPKGFAHGFEALEDSIVLYKMTSEYSKDHSRGIIWNDPELGIAWPSGPHPLLSDADRSWPGLAEAETY